MIPSIKQTPLRLFPIAIAATIILIIGTETLPVMAKGSGPESIPDIEGATSSTYTVQSSDNGKVIKVRVTFTDDAGNAESLTSEATSAMIMGGL